MNTSKPTAPDTYNVEMNSTGKDTDCSNSNARGDYVDTESYDELDEAFDELVSELEEAEEKISDLEIKNAGLEARIAELESEAAK